MILFKPYTDEKILDELFPNTKKQNGASAFVVIEQKAVLGKALFFLENQTCTIERIVFENDRFSLLYADGLIRSVLNFSANRGAYIAVCNLQLYKDLLLSLHFHEVNGVYTGEIPEILTCTSCSRSNPF